MHDRRARTVGGRFPALASFFPSRPCSTIGKPANHSHERYRTHFSAGFVARLSTRRTLMRFVMAIVPFMCDAAGPPFLESSVRAQTAVHSEAIDRFGKFIDEASGRFGVPARWIRAVMRVESGGDEHAISSRGAIGLMQLMPGTWVELSVRYGLGIDPFDAHDNIVAGTAYLKEMRNRFGSAGFLAAYHAGPARYEQHLATGRPLPQETVAYVAAVTPLLDDEQGEHTPTHNRHAVPWQEAPLFVERTEPR